MTDPKKIASGPIAWMARNTVVANLLMGFMLIAGAFIGSGIKQEIFPEVTLDIITASAVYPGASPGGDRAGDLLTLRRGGARRRRGQEDPLQRRRERCDGVV